MNYEQGLKALRKLSNDTNWLAEAQLYEARLLDNLQQERFYGSSPQCGANRAQIVDQLNRLVYKHLGISFNDLCQGLLPKLQLTSVLAPDIASDTKQKVQKSNLIDSARPISSRKVFIGYSHKDKRFLDELRVHLELYIRSGAMEVWDDTMIIPGSKWYEEIKDAIQSAGIAIFLVSANFLASDFIAQEELPLLLQATAQKGIKILCVIVRPCVFEDTKLAQFHAVNAPSRPLSNMTLGKRDEVWIQVATSIRDMLFVLPEDIF